MDEKNVIKMMEVRSSSGDLLCSIKIKGIRIIPKEDNDNSFSNNSSVDEGNDSINDDLMTSAQKRYLFRLLAERGIGKEKAHAYLKNMFIVEDLKNVKKVVASQAIEKLLAEQKGVDNNKSSE